MPNTEMTNLFVPISIALVLKELGFNEPTPGFYTINKKLYAIHTYHQGHSEAQLCSAPTYQQVEDWFRIKHNVLVQSICCGYSSDITKSDFKFRGNYFDYKEGSKDFPIRKGERAKYDAWDDSITCAMIKLKD